MNKNTLNADNEGNDDVMVLGEEESEDLFGNSIEIASFNGFSFESSNEGDININYNDKQRQTWTKDMEYSCNGVLLFE